MTNYRPVTAGTQNEDYDAKLKREALLAQRHVIQEESADIILKRYYSITSHPGKSETESPKKFEARITGECNMTAPTVLSTASLEINLPEWLEGAMDRISELEKLSADWDSYGSPPVHPEICRVARELFYLFREWELPTPFIAPVAGGGLYLKMKTDKRELEIELNDPNSKYASCLCVEKHPREKLHEETIRIDDEFRSKVHWLLDPTIRLFA